MAIALSFQELVFSHGKEVVVQTSSIVGEVNKTVFFFFYKTYFKPKIHKTIASN